MKMSIELQIALLGVLVALAIGAWQIHLARKQLHISRKDSNIAPVPESTPEKAQRNSDNLLHRLWGRLEPDLQEALSLAYNQAKREGKNRISTRTFFAAVA